MLEAKLWHDKTKTKNVKFAKMVEFIKNGDQHPCRFNFDNFFNSIILLTLSARKNVDLQKILSGRNG